MLLEHPTFLSVTRRSVAGAIWLGLFLGLLPLPGQTAVVLLAALVLRVNLPIALLTAWITNPVTMVPIFYWEYRLGAMILGIPVRSLLADMSWARFADELDGIWKPLLLGSFITATVVSSSAYVAVSVVWRQLVMSRYRRRRALLENR